MIRLVRQEERRRGQHREDTEEHRTRGTAKVLDVRRDIVNDGQQRRVE